MIAKRLGFIRGGNIDWVIIIVATILAFVGVATIYTITYVSVGNSLANSQIIYLLVGMVLFYFTSRQDYRIWHDISIILFVFSVIVSLPLLPIWSNNFPFVICEFASCRWINLGLFRFQTSEVIKLAGIILMARIFCHQVGNVKIGHAVIALMVLAGAAFLVSQQPDLGSSIVILVSAMAVLAASRLKWWFWLIILSVGLLSSPLVWNNLKPYQQRRVIIFLNPSLDPTKSGYNVRQAEIAVGSGGVWGQGFGQGTQSQLNFLPVAHTDFIFAGYAEATGFIGSMALLLLYVILLTRSISIAQNARDSFGRLVGIGIVAQLGVQITINVGMNIGLLPVTGVPLPLISFGGTSVFMTLISLGIIQSIASRRKAINLN